jgi:hypothetical protein
MVVGSRSCTGAIPESIPELAKVIRLHQYSMLCLAFALSWAAVSAAAEPPLVRPAKVISASGPGFPERARNGQPADPQYTADRAIDGDPSTFCCLLDDSLDGYTTDTTPAYGASPVTGHMVFDLGKPYLVSGLRLTARNSGGAYNPQDIEVFRYVDGNPAEHRVPDDIEGDDGIRLVAEKQRLAPVRNGKSAVVTWEPIVLRYVGLRVNSGHESGPKHFNFQIAEIAFVAMPRPAGLRVGQRIPGLYQKRDSLATTMLATRQSLSTLTGGKGSMPDSQLASVWSSLRRDFGSRHRAFFADVHYGWFAGDGWFAHASDTKLEQAFLEQSLADAAATKTAAVLRRRLAELQAAKTSPDDPRWLDLCLLAAAMAETGKRQASLRLAIGDLAGEFPGQYPAAELIAQLTVLEDRLAEVAEGTSTKPPAALADATRALQREALVLRNPLLSPGRLLFVKRFTYSPGYYYAEFMRASRFGGNLCVLSLPDGKVTELVPSLAGGIIDRFDLSFDGQRVVFSYKAAPGKGFRLYEVNTDGSGLRQLTHDPPDEAARIARYWHPRQRPAGVYRHHTDDFHPCYLPDGAICFASTRCEQGVLCDQSDSLSVNVLYRRELDGTLTQLSQGALSESTPSVMNDGRILYTRWEYVDKGVIAVQALWAMRPDGTGTVEVYGDEIAEPPVLIHARAVPGRPNQTVTTATMHHPFAVGPILLLDTSRDIRSLDPIRNLTPDTSLSVAGIGSFPNGERYTHWRNGRWVGDNIGPLFSEPYPLAAPASNAGAGKYFLVTCNPDQSWNHPSAYGLYLIDIFGNRVPILQDREISCWQPVPLRPRPVPPQVAVAAEAMEPMATVVLRDVYQGLTGVGRGTVKYLRVLEQIPRPWSARRFWPKDEAHGQHAIVSLNAHIYVKVLLGVVPVHEDGSAHFRVPADRNLFFQALDGDYLEVNRMRTFVDYQPGETRSCIGCHEPHASAPPLHGHPEALAHAPDAVSPQPGDDGPRPLHFPTDIQPILDRHCVRCHSGEQPKAKLNLSGTLTTYFSTSYEQIMRRGLVRVIQEFKGPQQRAQKRNVKPLPPYSLGSHASKLIAVLRKGHHRVQLSREDMLRLTTWVDANAPYYGSYFGRRNLVYRNHPDFRPVPTLDAARGSPPKQYGP